MGPVTYLPIGVVHNTIEELLPPEEIRGIESRLDLLPQFEEAVAGLSTGDHLIVVYHLHRACSRFDSGSGDIFTRRVAVRPNPIGVTLTQVVNVVGTVITVIGLDAVNGTPLLDLKPYKPIFDAPPVHPEG